MNLAIIGSRDFTDYEYLCSVLLKHPQPSLIVSGGARGADALARRYATEHNIPILEFKPNYNEYKPTIAPIMRNKEIVDHSHCIIALWNGISRGTLHTIKYAKSQNKNVHIYNCDLIKNNTLIR